jgi:hypothetical protein
MRKVISFTGAVALFVGAAYWLYFTLYEAASYPRWFLVGPPVLMCVAAYWLWEDFLSPWLSRASVQKNQYAKEVDEHLRVMFDGFERRIFKVLTWMIDLRPFIAEHERNRTPVQECAVYAAAFLLAKMIEQLPEKQKLAALDALRDKDLTNKLYLGVSQMFSVVDRFGVPPPLKRWMLYQVIGALRGMTAEQIASWWGEAEVNRVADEIERSQ